MGDQEFPLLPVWQDVPSRTDHAALTHLRKFSDPKNRLLSWSLKLSELDLVFEHRAGLR